ncbi:MAG TPA: chemotaxis protein CheW [Methanospirillum sp.]|nr:chemotaxis protein CheW [Methanospirillum sp.]
MEQDEQVDRNGRLALFKGIGVQNEQEKSIPVHEIITSIRQIAETDELSTIAQIPGIDIFNPIIERLTSLAQNIALQDADTQRLEKEKKSLETLISTLSRDNDTLTAEHDSYLQELITSQTEFDRVLELFAYHPVPMALIGEEELIFDANEAFCTLFSIEKSEITKAHPPIRKFLPEEPDATRSLDDTYSTIILSPPIIPCNHEIVSLVIVLQNQNHHDSVIQEISVIEEEQKNVVPDPDILLTLAFNKFPVPAVIIDEYRIIVQENDAFCTLCGRDISIIRRRDIGSCGLRSEDADYLNGIFSSSEPIASEGVITQLDGNESGVYLNAILLNESSPYKALIIALKSDSEEDLISQSDDQDILLRTLLNLNASAITLIGHQAHAVRANEGFTELTGLTPDDLAGIDIRDLGIPIPDNAILPGFSGINLLSKPFNLESAWGTQRCTGMIVSLGCEISGVLAVLLIQPHTEEELIPLNLLQNSLPHTQKEVSEEGSRQEEIGDQEDVNPPDKIQNPDLMRVPIPLLVCNGSGQIIRTNNAMISLLGGTDTATGTQYNTFVNHVTSEYISIRMPSGERRFKEIISSIETGEDETVYWFVEVEKECNRIEELIKKNQVLENDNQELRQKSRSSGRWSGAERGGSEQIDIVEFELSGERYAIDITMVREVVEMLPITPLPKTPPYVVGIINLRGEVTHIIDLAMLLGEQGRKERMGQKIIIIPSDVTKGEHVGIIVDNVQSVTEVQGRSVTSLGEDINAQIKTHIKGIIKLSRDDILEKHTEDSQNINLVIWLDMVKILHDLQGTP